MVPGDRDAWTITTAQLSVKYLCRFYLKRRNGDADHIPRVFLSACLVRFLPSIMNSVSPTSPISAVCVSPMSMDSATTLEDVGYDLEKSISGRVSSQRDVHHPSVKEPSSPNMIAPAADQYEFNKKGVEVHEQPVSPSSSIWFAPPPTQSKPAHWKSSVLYVGPLCGLGALLFAFIQILVCFAVLKASDNVPVAHWKFQPTVYLAISTAISNKALSFAVIKGTIVTWWLKAIRGTTLSSAHNDWSYGFFVYKAIAAGRNFNALALACVMATLVAMDGPLLQRASSVRLRVPTEAVPLQVSISPEVPAYFTGYASYDFPPSSVEGFADEFIPVLMDYRQNAPMTGAVTGCVGSCAATLRAPALALQSCQSSLFYQNYTETLSKAEYNALEATGSSPLDRNVFAIQFDVSTGTREVLLLQTNLTDSSVAKTCSGHLNVTTCEFLSAIGECEYELVVCLRLVLILLSFGFR